MRNWHDGRGTASIDGLVRDIHYGVRRLVRDWRFTVAAVAILGLGIGANTAIFSLVNATLLRHQSIAAPDRLVDIYQNASNAGGIDGNSYPAYLDMAAHTDVFESTTAAFVPRGVNYQDQGALRPAVVEHTTATGTASGGGGSLREGAAAGWRHRRAGASRDEHSRDATGIRVPH
jgi:hypothetical protein